MRRTGAGYMGMTYWLLFGHFVIPFLLLVSRFPKRHPNLLVLGAVWVLVVHYSDMAWLVLPEVADPATVPIPILDFCLFLGFGGLFVASATYALPKRVARPGARSAPGRVPRVPELLR